MTASRESELEQKRSLKSGRPFAIELARAVADTRCHSVVLLDVAGISPVTDFFIIATGTSPRQMRSAADAAAEMAESLGAPVLSRVGDESGQWIVADLFDVVLHVFSQESRLFYDLDALWGDAPRVVWERDTPKKG